MVLLQDRTGSGRIRTAVQAILASCIELKTAGFPCAFAGPAACAASTETGRTGSTT